MAGRVDILLKLVGDAKDAIRGFDQTTAAAKRTEEQAKRTQSGVSQFFQTIPGMAVAATAAVGFVERQFSQIQDAIASGKATQAQKDLALAASPQEEARALVAQAGAQSYKRRLSLTDPFTWSPGNVLADGGSLVGSLLGFGGRARKQRQDDFLEQQLVGMNPDDLARLAPYLPQAGQLLGPVSRATAYRTTARQGGNTTNVYNQLPVGYDARQVNRSMDNYNRVNGKLPST